MLGRDDERKVEYGEPAQRDLVVVGHEVLERRLEAGHVQVLLLLVLHPLVLRVAVVARPQQRHHHQLLEEARGGVAGEHALEKLARLLK